jgi:hypothetical protein
MQQQPVDLLQIAEAPEVGDVMRRRSATGVLEALEVQPIAPDR